MKITVALNEDSVGRDLSSGTDDQVTHPASDVGDFGAVGVNVHEPR